MTTETLFARAVWVNCTFGFILLGLMLAVTWKGVWR